MFTIGRIVVFSTGYRSQQDSFQQENDSQEITIEDLLLGLTSVWINPRRCSHDHFLPLNKDVPAASDSLQPGDITSLRIRCITINAWVFSQAEAIRNISFEA
jgi:hypothetical protein